MEKFDTKAADTLEIILDTDQQARLVSAKIIEELNY
jgi:1-deoxy-D-xylulose-5-phosphate reductoisomerase